MIESKIKSISPEYLEVYHSLVTDLAQFGGGREEDKFRHGKSFSNAYEFYMYAFFLGIKENRKVEIAEGDKTKKFWEINNWKPAELSDYLITVAIAVSEFDMSLAEQQDELELKSQISVLKNTIQSYANGGLQVIKELLEEDPDAIDNYMLFISLLLDYENDSAN